MADSETTSLKASPAAGDANQDDESRMLLGFLQYQRDAVLKIVKGLPEEAWQTPVVPSGWTVAGMVWHIAGAEYHWFQNVTTGGREKQPSDDDHPDEEEEEEVEEYDPYAAFTCDLPSADIIAGYRDVCRRSDEVLAVTPLSAAPRGAHTDPELEVPNVRWIVLHMIEETATHSGHLEIARELLDGKTRLGGR
ncbi:MAG TPA: DinB family protein [Streptosporangiaceae bacterium]|jgi:hypothetical protein